MLDDILKNNKCFKLILGAGNKSVEEIEKLVFTYSVAGCNFFDLSPYNDVILAAKKGLKRAGISKNRYLCVSIGTKDDPHTGKAKMSNECKNCGKCSSFCLEKAIFKNISKFEINPNKCIGCARCVNHCPNHAIVMTNEIENFDKILNNITNFDIDCIEFHAQNSPEVEYFEKWKHILTNFNGMAGICLNRSNLSDFEYIKRIKKAAELSRNKIIVQTDGIPMSGGIDDFETTRSAVEASRVVNDANLDVYIIPSGGTNSKTSGLAKREGILINGVAVGSYARKIVRDYISKPNYFNDEASIKKAVAVAKKLVNTVI